jgi:hypothetical protein
MIRLACPVRRGADPLPCPVHRATDPMPCPAHRATDPLFRPASGWRPRALPWFVATAFATLPLPLQADGGTLRVANVPMGAYRVSVFTDPTPIPPDTIDVSVLATFERGRGIARDLHIDVTARRMDGMGIPVRHPATRAQADDPRYYAAKFALGAVGDWEIGVQIRGPEGEGEVFFQVTVREPGLLGNPFLVLTLALMPLLLVGWWLKRSGGPPSTPPPSRPAGR